MLAAFPVKVPVTPVEGGGVVLLGVGVVTGVEGVLLLGVGVTALLGDDFAGVGDVVTIEVPPSCPSSWPPSCPSSPPAEGMAGCVRVGVGVVVVGTVA